MSRSLRIGADAERQQQQPCPRHHRQRRWPATVRRDTRRHRHGRSRSETSALPVGADAEQQQQQHAQAPPTAGDEKTNRTHRAALAARRNAAHWQRHRARSGAGASAVGAADVSWGRRTAHGRYLTTAATKTGATAAAPPTSDLVRSAAQSAESTLSSARGGVLK